MGHRKGFRPLSIRTSILALAAALLSACVGAPAPTEKASDARPSDAAVAVSAAVVPTTSAAQGTGSPAVPNSASAEAEAGAFLAKAREAEDSQHLAEAIRSYVAAIAIFEESPLPATRAIADKAASALQKIGQRLSIEPAGEWLDARGSQISASTRNLGKGRSPFPSVYLFENFGAGKSPVADAPIFFEFVKNSGSLLPLVSTDAYGKSNTTIARIDEPGKEAVIRAYPLFRVRGKSYAFRSVFRDFSYLPPAPVARVFALETTPLGARDNPQSVDAVATALKPLGLAILPFNGKLAPEAFMRAFGGDTSSLATLGASIEAPYTAFVLVEAREPRQMELNGVKYNIFTSAVDASFRLVRAEGTIVFALPLSGLKGQGGTPEAALQDGLKRGREAIIAELQKELGALRTAIETE